MLLNCLFYTAEATSSASLDSAQTPKANEKDDATKQSAENNADTPNDKSSSNNATDAPKTLGKEKTKSNVSVPNLDLGGEKHSKKKKLNNSDTNSSNPSDKLGPDAKPKAKTPDKDETPKEKRFTAIKSKTQTLIVHKSLKDKTSSKSLLNTSIDTSVNTLSSSKENGRIKSANKLLSYLKTKRLTNLNDKIKSGDKIKADNNDLGIIREANERQSLKSTNLRENKTRSTSLSSLNSSLNVTNQAQVYKPKSATVSATKTKYQHDQREESAKTKTKKLETTAPESNSDTSIPSTKAILKGSIVNHTAKDVKATPRSSKEDISNIKPVITTVPVENKMTPRNANKTGLSKIKELEREESSVSVFPGRTELEIRLSTIKRKVEVKRRGRDSRSSFGSDLDVSVLDRLLTV